MTIATSLVLKQALKNNSHLFLHVRVFICVGFFVI